MYNAEEREQLIEHHLWLTVTIARKFGYTGQSEDDLASVGSVGLVKAVDTFDPDRDIQLTTYAYRCIENEIRMYLNKSSKKTVEISIDEPFCMDREGHELTLSDMLGTEEDEIFQKVEDHLEIQLMWKAMGGLSCRDRTLIELRFGLFPGGREQTQQEVAEQLGLSQSYVCKLEQRIIKRLRRKIVEYDSCNSCRKQIE